MLVLEPTDLNILLGGVGVLWVEIEVAGRAAHAEVADRSVNAIELALPLVAALRRFEEWMNVSEPDAAFGDVTSPYKVNLGTITGGDWPSSVPGTVRLGVRVGFPRSWSPKEAEQRVRAAILDESRSHPWLVEHPPRVRCTGFRAEGHYLDASDPLVTAVAEAHAEAHGSRPRLATAPSTTDARFYLNQFDCPALCYGPTARRLHGVDEAVELASIVQGARTLARFISRWFLSPSGGACEHPTATSL